MNFFVFVVAVGLVEAAATNIPTIDEVPKTTMTGHEPITAPQMILQVIQKKFKFLIFKNKYLILKIKTIFRTFEPEKSAHFFEYNDFFKSTLEF